MQQQYGADYIRRGVYNARRQYAPVEPILTAQAETPKKEGGDLAFLTIFIGIIIVGFSLSTAYVMMGKKIDFDLSSFWKSEPEVVAVTPVVPYPQAPPVAAYLTRNEAQQWKSSQDMRIDELERKLSSWNLRLWKLSLAVNENAMINRQVDQQFHPGAVDKYITLDADWKLNKSPENQTLTEDQKQLLLK